MLKTKAKDVNSRPYPTILLKEDIIKRTLTLLDQLGFYIIFF